MKHVMHIDNIYIYINLKQSIKRLNKLFQLIYKDLIEPISKPLLSRTKYFAILSDDFS